MIAQNTVAETRFGAKIQFKFPYSSSEQAAAIIEESRSISANAVFYVLDEICRPPFKRIVSRKRQRELLQDWAAGFEHPLKELVLRCAERLISRRPLTPAEAVAAMEEIALFDGQRAALSVAYFSGDSSTLEGDAALSSTADRIRNFWDTKGV